VVLTNDGAGTFTATQTNASPSAFAVAISDLNGDGKLDFVVANSTNNPSGMVTGYTNDGAGGFAAAFTNSVGNQPGALALADFNSDGRVDVASANSTSPGSVSVLLNSRTYVFNGRFVGDGAGLINLSTDALTGGLTTNVPVLVPGGFTNTLVFTNGILRGVQ
jgi:hypothetical protein